MSQLVSFLQVSPPKPCIHFYRRRLQFHLPWFQKCKECSMQFFEMKLESKMRRIRGPEFETLRGVQFVWRLCCMTDWNEPSGLVFVVFCIHNALSCCVTSNITYYARTVMVFIEFFVDDIPLWHMNSKNETQTVNQNFILSVFRGVRKIAKWDC